MKTRTNDDGRRSAQAAGQRRLLDLQTRGDEIDDNLYAAPGRYGGGGAGTAWLVGSADEVAVWLWKYRDLGGTHCILSDSPYLAEVARQGERRLPLLSDRAAQRRLPPRPARG